MTLKGPGDFDPPYVRDPWIVYQCQDCDRKWMDDEIEKVLDINEHGKTVTVGHCPCCDSANLLRAER